MMTNMFLVLYQLGSSCIYVVFIASNLKVVSESGTQIIVFWDGHSQ